MDNRRNIKRKPRKRKQKFNVKKILLSLIVILSVIGCVKIALAYKNEQDMVKNEQLKREELQNELEEKENNQPVVGQRKKEKELYGVDSQKVWNALNAYDYDNGGNKEIFLTFDDGPSTTNTPEVLRILKENKVKGTFFVIGKSLKIDGAPQILKDIYDQGHAIGNHSFSHNYAHLYPSRVLNLKNFTEDFNQNDDLIKQSLGMENFSTRAIRFPGGQISWKGTAPVTEQLIKDNRASIDWNALNGDAEGPKKNADELYNFAIKSSENKNLVVLLMHDTYGKEETVKSLDRIIKHFKSKGYKFKTLI